MAARPSRRHSVLLDNRNAPPPPSHAPTHLKRFTLTSKPNWWLVEVDDDDSNQTVNSFDSDETAISDDHQSPPTSSSRFKRFANHPTQLFQFPTPPAYSAPPNPTSHLSPIATGSTSELFQCVIKKPDVTEFEINGERQSNGADVQQQFLAELRVYRSVTRHRNIVAFLGCLEGLGMVLEYVDGTPLLDVIRNSQCPLSPETKIDFHNQLISGLSHLHSFGLSHGDLSLLNVHVTKHYQILKILDFGRSTSSRTYTPPPPKVIQTALKRRSLGYRSGYSTPTPKPPTPAPMLDSDSRPFEPEQIHPGTRPFTAPEILREECTDAILADAYSFGMILLCLDLDNLVDVDPKYQREDGEIDTTHCQIFGERIKEYTRPWRERRRILVEDAIKGT